MTSLTQGVPSSPRLDGLNDFFVSGDVTAEIITGNTRVSAPLVTATNILANNITAYTSLTTGGPITPTYSGTAPTSTQIGYSVISSASTVVPTGSATDLQSLSLGKGVWLVEGITAMAMGAATSTVVCSLSTQSTVFDYTRAATFSAPTVGYVPRTTISVVFQFSATTTVYFVAKIDSGTVSSTTNYIRASRIA